MTSPSDPRSLAAPEDEAASSLRILSAIRCAQAIQRADHAIGIPSRVGVHCGEVERAGAAIRGISVHIASRLSALAAPSEILASTTVRDLAAGSGIDFEDRGMHNLKGVPELWQVLAVAA